MTSDLSPTAAMHAAAAAALDLAGVTWCRLRDAHGGPEDDLLVASDDLDRAAHALASVGFARVRHLGHGSHRAFHAVDRATGVWAKIDAVTRIDLGAHQEVRTTLAAGFLARRLLGASGRGSGEATLAPDDAFWALLLHELRDRPAPAIRRPDDLAAAARQAHADARVAHEVRPILPAGTEPATVIRMSAVGDRDGLLRLGRRMRSRPGAFVRVRRLVARGLRALDRCDPPFVRRGLSIGLIGPGGTGSSSIARAIADRAAAPLPVQVVASIGMWRGWLVGRVGVARGRLVIFDLERSGPDSPDDLRPTIDRVPPTGRRFRALPGPDLVVVLDDPGRPMDALARDVMVLAWDRLAARTGRR